jgi:hypothetical protein
MCYMHDADLALFSQYVPDVLNNIMKGYGGPK